MIGTVLSWFAGKGIGAIGDQLNRAYSNKLNAKNDHERIKADKEIADLQAQQNILIAEQGSWMTRWIRPMMALPFVVYLNKIIIWDKVLGWGTTDTLSPELWQMFTGIFIAYFGTRWLEKKR